MPKRIETISQSYRGHAYELALTFSWASGQASAVTERLTKASFVVDETRIYSGTPGFLLESSELADVKEAVFGYIDYLEAEGEKAGKA